MEPWEDKERQQIMYLPKDHYDNYVLDFKYETTEYLDVLTTKTSSGLTFSIIRKSFGELVRKGFTSNLYPEYCAHAMAFGIFDTEQLIAVLEVDKDIGVSDCG